MSLADAWRRHREALQRRQAGRRSRMAGGRTKGKTKGPYWTERPAVIAVAAVGLALIALAIALWRMAPDPPDAIPTAALEPIAVDTDRDVLGAGEARNLSASEGVWRATRVLVGLAAVQLSLGVIGLILVVRTLQATRETARIVRAGESAYVFGEFRVERPAGEAQARRWFTLGVKNVGRTAARDVRVTVVCRRYVEGQLRHFVLAHDELVGPMEAGEMFPVHREELPETFGTTTTPRSEETLCVVETTWRTVFDTSVGPHREAKWLVVSEDFGTTEVFGSADESRFLGFREADAEVDLETVLEPVRAELAETRA